MAYQTRERDPLLDSNMQAAIEKRGKELIGIALLVLAGMAAAMIASYTPSDPSWISATDAPVQNWMGRIGASIAAPLFMIIGWAAWGIALIFGGWGLRFLLHRGEERALGRLVFAPILIAVTAVYASTLVPGDSWTHSFGLGGLFGDTVLGAVLNFLPVNAAMGLKAISAISFFATLGLGLFVLGATMDEVKRFGRFLLVGVILTYAYLMAALGKGAGGVVKAAKHAREKRAERREMAAAAMPHEDEPVLFEEDFEVAPQAAAPKAGFLKRMPALVKRPDPEVDAMPEPELVAQSPVADVAEMPGQDRIRAKIADVIRSRSTQGADPAPTPEVLADKPLTKGRGRGPDPLVLDNGPRHGLPPEPPLTAARVQPAVPETMVDDTPETALPLDEVAEPVQTIPVAQVEQKKVVQPRAMKPVVPSTKARAEAQPSLAFDEPQVEYELPPLSLLTNPSSIQRHYLSDEALEENARMLEAVLDDYGVKGEIVSVRPGPVVTMYELEPAPGLKASRVIGLADDIARSMSALSARVSTVPGRSVIGIELPNENREKVVLREILAARDFGDSNQKLPLALGKDIGGDPVVANLAKMPHLLIAGTTGSGKSVAINTMILSLLYRLTPEDCRLIMIDPKMLELSVYDGIPHLLSPVVTDPKKAVVALKWTVGEMEDRYRKMSKMGVRNIDGYNSRVAEALAKGEMFSRTVQTGFDDETGEPVFETEEIQPEKMPYIVVVVDEMADLMMVAGKEIEACIQRLAQMARASGIHLIMATQRPSVDVITGTIKANFPTRISFQVTSKVDSRTILGEMGAEQLLGMGDMLYMAGGAKITRCHGPFVSDEEVEEIVNHLKSFGPPSYMSGVVEGPDEEKADNIDAVLGLGGNTTGEDALYDQAVQIVIQDRKCSTSYIQRKLAIGYNKAARLVEQMEEEGLVSAANHVGKREILVPEQ
ncbi:DNA translocase FtsK [Shimia biformata]|uniref:DNA translocase FtsK n=1 Tax=Shimia biformata TaxID=1294299 RepID=UPI00194E10D4|nr:DNA translocase FtsK [Shimia biformata]